MRSTKFFVLFFLITSFFLLNFEKVSAAEIDWSSVGTTPSGLGSSDISFAFNPNTNEPYMAYADPSNDNKITVKRFDGTDWVSVGSTLPTDGDALYISLSFDPLSGDPFVAFRDLANNGWLSVMRYIEGSGWGYFAKGIGTGGVSHIKLNYNEFDDKLYVAFFQHDASDYTTGRLLRFNTVSGGYTEIKNSEEFGFIHLYNVISVIDSLSLEFNPQNGEPYICYFYLDAYVKRFDGINWIEVGDTVNDPDGGLAYSPSIAFNPTTNEPYVVYSDNDNQKKAIVKKFNDSSWVDIGQQHFSETSQNSFYDQEKRIAFNNYSGKPFVISGYGGVGIIAYEFNGTSWEDMGNFYSENVLVRYYDMSLVFNPSTNEPYVGFANGWESQGYKKFFVFKLNYNNVITPTSSPAGGTFSSAQSVTISSETDGASIYYTTNGSTPTTGSTLYSSSITISEDTTVKAIAVKDGMADSELMMEEYIINISEDPEEPEEDLSSPVYRFYSPTGKSHFFTTSSSEKNRIIANYSNDWRYEGIAYYSYASSNSGLSPIYRFYSPTGKSHFFTISESEKNNVIANYSNDWNYEGIAYYAYTSSSSGRKPVYRFYSPTGRSHFFTNSESEKNNVITKYSNDWRYEGISWYVPE